MPQKTERITLRTEVHQGHECVKRHPATISGHRKDIDAVQIVNGNSTPDGSSITVTMDPQTRGNLFVDAPAGPVELQPGESINLTVKSTLNSAGSEGFTTDPAHCAGDDSGDIVIQP